MNTQPIEIRIGDQVIRGDFFVPVEPRQNQAVLFLHGWTGKTNKLAAAYLAENGYTAMTISFRGHNNSDGDIEKVTREQLLTDAVTAYEYLTSRLPEGMPVCLVGNSFGSYIAALLSQLRPVNAISLRVPANYLDDGFDMKQKGQGNENPLVAAWRLEQLLPDATRSLMAVHAFEGKVQILEAELDLQVPSQTVMNYASAVSNKEQLEYHVMKGWPHSLADDKNRNKEFQTILLEWLNRL